MTANNVIRGPWVGNDPTPVIVNATLASSGVNLIKATHIQNTLVAIMPMVFHNIELAGFHVSDDAVDDTLKDGTLIVEAVKSMLYKHYGLYHPLQDVAEAVFVQEDGNPNVNALDFVGQLNISLDPPEPLCVGYEDDYDEDEDAVEE